MSETATPWYKDAVIYQVYPRGFYDSNADGIGDLRGLPKSWITCVTGVDCLGSCPFILRLKDDSYDIAILQHPNSPGHRRN